MSCLGIAYGRATLCMSVITIHFNRPNFNLMFLNTIFQQNRKILLQLCVCVFGLCETVCVCFGLSRWFHFINTHRLFHSSATLDFSSRMQTHRHTHTHTHTNKHNHTRLCTYAHTSTAGTSCVGHTHNQKGHCWHNNSWTTLTSVWALILHTWHTPELSLTNTQIHRPDAF